MYIFKGTDNVGTYAFLNEVVSIADLVAYRNVLIINLVSSRKQPCRNGGSFCHRILARAYVENYVSKALRGVRVNECTQP